MSEDWTALLNRAADGEAEASGRLFELLYVDLRDRAGQMMRGERSGHTLQPTALVHEAWIRMVDLPEKRFRSRAQFFALAAKAMRSVLVDHARRRKSAKRGGDWERLGLEGVFREVDERACDLLALDDALRRLEAQDPRLARVVELRFFAGLEHAEAARTLGVSTRTVERDWRLARSWLRRAMGVDTERGA